jgi:hypothetical protein
LRCYGENSATFLIFKALSDAPPGIRKLLLTLLQAGNGQGITEDLVPDADPTVWLFPNFGKRHGFGEPDVLILIGGQSFWFEVETRVDLGFRRNAARHSLLQLARFHLLHDALRRGDQVRSVGTPHMAYSGPTVTNSGNVKYGILRTAGHPVLQSHAGPLRYSTPHYVIMSIRQAAGVGGGQVPFGTDLGNLATATFTSIQRSLESWRDEQAYNLELPPLPPSEPIWYTYWYGHALDKCYPRFDLRLMPSVGDVGDIPTAVRPLVIVADVRGVLHFRIIGGDDRIVADTDETRLTAQAGPIAALKMRLEHLWPPTSPGEEEKDQIITAVTSIVGYTRSDPLGDDRWADPTH